jgi:hypothetical protein
MSNGQKTCFVIMGFGEKTDFQSNPQRVLNLDKTYNNIIKPVVEEAGLACIRADEIIHSTVIDKPMYDNLLSADIVIADLSTSNANAIYELGVRHALRPRTTVVMAEHKRTARFSCSFRRFRGRDRPARLLEWRPGRPRHRWLRGRTTAVSPILWKAFEARRQRSRNPPIGLRH